MSIKAEIITHTQKKRNVFNGICIPQHFCHVTPCWLKQYIFQLPYDKHKNNGWSNNCNCSFFFLLLDLLYVDQGNISHILYFKIFKSQCVRLSATFSSDFKETSFYIKIFFIQAKAILIDWGLEGSPHLLFISKYFKIMQRIMGETIVFAEYAAICKTKLIFFLKNQYISTNVNIETLNMGFLFRFTSNLTYCMLCVYT